uniref:Uncharacterized protein n=1 Tax=uncultured bacterium fosmid pJB77G10 TaxID=1478069 RepID=A0A0H3U823_9BACT|nr:hypothetical protein [uncultured bacterium fosmid pJB77G10]
MNNWNEKGSGKINWESKNIKYKHFVDAGKYVLFMNDVDYVDVEKSLEYIRTHKDPFNGGCTATVKLNSKGEVIVGRNMDVTVSQSPAIISHIVGGKYDTLSFYFGGNNADYTYQQLDEMDNDEGVLSLIPYAGTDAMNETGLYIEANMREPDKGYEKIFCTGTNPGKPRACILSAATLIALNCSTVEEAVAFLRDSYDWYALGFDARSYGFGLELWNLSLIIGDAQGNRGLVEFGMNGIYYTPYPNGQGNYYIHPKLAEYSIRGSGYGRFAAALEHLEECETEWDMLHNMENSMMRQVILEPGCLGYSDLQQDVNIRRETPEEELKELYIKKNEPFIEPAIEYYYKGNEKPLRDNGGIWTTSLNFGVNCATKHLILRFWEKDDTIFEYQW